MPYPLSGVSFHLLHAAPAAPADFAALAVAAAAGHAIPLRVPAVALLHLW